MISEAEKWMTLDRLKRTLEYDARTGIFRWRARTSKIRVGDIAGTSAFDGYIIIQIEKRRFRAHRLAWLYVHGVWPKDLIDHRNGQPGDNRISNLREATSLQNGRNRKAQGGRVLKGISYSDGRWRAQITIAGKATYIGLFDTPEDAHAAYAAMARQHFGEFARI